LQEITTVRDRARYVPAQPSFAVARSRLDELLSDASGRVVRVLAPGGYGKTSLIARWAASDRRAVGWLDIERVDNDPSVLLISLASALAGLDGFDLSELPRGARDAELFVETVVPEFGAMVRDCRTPFALMVDDVHLLEAPASLALIDALARNLGPASTLVIAGRRYAQEESVARLRLHPGVIDVTASDLALSITEADEMLGALGIAIDLDDLTALTERFEGWPAGIRLAALAIKAGGDPSADSPADAGDTTFVTDYLRTEWMGQLGHDDREFLAEAACLERFTSSMCDDVLGRRGSGEVLRRLQRQDLVVIPLDQRDEWFRMHSLLAHWLAAELRSRDPDRWRDVHHGASRWWAAHGDIDLAFEHAMLVGDLESCELLVATNAPLCFPRGQVATVQRWLERFPREFVASSGSLCAMSSFAAMQVGEGDRALVWVEALGRLVDGRTADVPTLDDSVRALSDALTASFAPRPARELLPIAERAVERLAPGPARDLALEVLIFHRYISGDLRAATDLDEAIFDAEVRDTPLMLARCLATRAVLADLQGDRERSESDGRRARDILVERRLDGMFPTTAEVFGINALLDARLGRTADAKTGIGSARRLLAGFTNVVPWYNLLSRLALIKACLLVDDREAADELLREADRYLRGESPGNPVERHLVELRDQLDAVQMVLSPGTALTSAEMRVMQYLPTNLTLADIATRLYVSRNTVKSHVAAIYRKMGTTSRAEAVDLARRAGLLAGHEADLAR
jgi:LuxR family transcriptional regulator, maltose regulon positive regulatory protein